MLFGCCLRWRGGAIRRGCRGVCRLFGRRLCGCRRAHLSGCRRSSSHAYACHAGRLVAVRVVRVLRFPKPCGSQPHRQGGAGSWRIGAVAGCEHFGVLPQLSIQGSAAARGQSRGAEVTWQWTGTCVTNGWGHIGSVSHLSCTGWSRKAFSVTGSRTCTGGAKTVTYAKFRNSVFCIALSAWLGGLGLAWRCFKTPRTLSTTRRLSSDGRMAGWQRFPELGPTQSGVAVTGFCTTASRTAGCRSRNSTGWCLTEEFAWPRQLTT